MIKGKYRMNPRTKRTLNWIRMSDTLVIVLAHPDNSHYVVLSGNVPDLKVKHYTSKQILDDDQCHWSSDCGMYDIRMMFYLGLYDQYFKKYPREALVPLIRFANNSQPTIKNRMSVEDFRRSVFLLSTDVTNAMPENVKKSHRHLKNLLRDKQ